MGTTDARHALLARLIDHAPTFPPASLAPAEALREDARAAASPHAFLLARLVWPASRLAELSSGREVSAVLDAPLGGNGSVAAVEVPPGFDLELIPAVPEVYVETRLDEALEQRLDELAGRGLRAKVRCGGSAVPSARALAGFVRACGKRGLRFKATAGLHHAVRTNGEHGFLNLLAAAVFEGDEEAVLADSDPGAFRLTEGAFAWRDRSATAADLTRVRRNGLHAIGSCSFFEPVEELEAVGVLPL
jgi:predicted transcriptional regulator